MKTRALVMAAVMALTAIASTRVAQAQEPLVVNIPFDFVAGNSQLPAGEYTVKVSAPTHSLILISRKDATASAFINTNAAVSAEPQSESKLIFNRYGDRYFLAQVWQQGYAQGRQLLKSSREKEVALSANIQTQSRVTLVAGLATTTR
jgi:malonyl CoA-acyl carrier protein transacylase